MSPRLALPQTEDDGPCQCVTRAALHFGHCCLDAVIDGGSPDDWCHATEWAALS